MAKANSTVLLGFVDEPITDKYLGQVNYCVNKIGGKPDFPNATSFILPDCPLCKLPRPLITQIYAPLENSNYHRTLYLFACVNSSCWSLEKSWLCIRIQSNQKTNADARLFQTESSTSSRTTDWCSAADDWDEDDFGENLSHQNEKATEPSVLENALKLDGLKLEEMGDKCVLGKNQPEQATAELETADNEVICIDTPILPENNLVVLLQEGTPLPENFTKQKRSLEFFPYFLSVWEETSKENSHISDQHVNELLKKYQNSDKVSVNDTDSLKGQGGSNMVTEDYEKGNPAHGDKMFHHFLTKIQENSGQILRYGRETNPLLLYPLEENPGLCEGCNSELVFEFQIIPTIISKLRLKTDEKQCARLEFGTVLVYTCKNSCWSTENKFKIEKVYLQTEKY